MRDSFLLLFLLFFLNVGLFYTPLSWWIYDPSFYYAYIRSAIIDSDLDFQNEARPVEVYSQVERTQTGKFPNVWPVGPAILWAPFFLMGHILTVVLNNIGIPIPIDGYSPIYIMFVGLGSALYGLIGIFFTYKLCTSYFSESLSLVASIIAWMATPIFFYTYKISFYAHSASLFTAALFIYIWCKTRGDRSGYVYITLGIVGGLMALARWQNAIFLLLPASDLIESLYRLSLESGNRLESIRGPTINLLLLFIFAFVSFSPQILMWKILYGRFFTIPQGSDFMHWFSPNVLEILFSSNRGLLFWEPIAMLGILGLMFLNRKDRSLTILFVVVLFLQVYINSVAGDWYGGGGFGPRRFDSCTPIFALGFASLLNKIRHRRLGTIVIALLCVILIVHQLSMVYQYYYTRLPLELYDHGLPIPISVFISNFMHIANHPILLLRPEASRWTTELPPFFALGRALSEGFDRHALLGGATLFVAVICLVALYYTIVWMGKSWLILTKRNKTNIALSFITAAMVIIGAIDVYILWLA